MSTENNLSKTFDTSIKILSDLIAFKSISGEDNNSIIDYCEKIFNNLGAESFKIYDSDKKRVNLFASIKSKNKIVKKPIILSGHTDVVPVSNGWSSDPFKAIHLNWSHHSVGSVNRSYACSIWYSVSPLVLQHRVVIDNCFT